MKFVEECHEGYGFLEFYGVENVRRENYVHDCMMLIYEESHYMNIEREPWFSVGRV